MTARRAMLMLCAVLLGVVVGASPAAARPVDGAPGDRAMAGVRATVAPDAVLPEWSVRRPSTAPARRGGRGYAKAADLRVMTFNLRFASRVRPNRWPRRLPVMVKLWQRERPHLVGTQEGRREQLADLRRALGDRYGDVGMGREGGDVGEHMSVFYDRERLRPLEHGHYWLSQTPDVVGSKSWPGCCPRMVTWVRFRDRVTGGRFYAVNTHLEAFSAPTRVRQARLLLARGARDLDPDLPVVLTADFNAPAGAGHDVFDLLVTRGPFEDTWQLARRRGPALGTFNNYRRPVPGAPRIDWILTTPGVRVRSARVVDFAVRGQYPSDHLPVHAVLRLD